MYDMYACIFNKPIRNRCDSTSREFCLSSSHTGTLLQADLPVAWHDWSGGGDLERLTKDGFNLGSSDGNLVCNNFDSHTTNLLQADDSSLTSANQVIDISRFSGVDGLGGERGYENPPICVSPTAIYDITMSWPLSLACHFCSSHSGTLLQTRPDQTRCANHLPPPAFGSSTGHTRSEYKDSERSAPTH